MNRQQAIYVVASHMAELMAGFDLAEVSGLDKAQQEQMSTEELALLDDARNAVIRRLYGMGKTMELPDKPYRALLFVDGKQAVHGPYKDEKNAIRAGKMWARREMRDGYDYESHRYPQVSVQVQHLDHGSWENVGELITDMKAS
jgi:hypothetical protein